MPTNESFEIVFIRSAVREVKATTLTFFFREFALILFINKKDRGKISKKLNLLKILFFINKTKNELLRLL